MKHVSRFLIWLSQKSFDASLWLDDLAGKVDPENSFDSQIEDDIIRFSSSTNRWPIVYPGLYSDGTTSPPNSTSEGIAKYRPETF